MDLTSFAKLSRHKKKGRNFKQQEQVVPTASMVPRVGFVVFRAKQ